MSQTSDTDPRFETLAEYLAWFEENKGNPEYRKLYMRIGAWLCRFGIKRGID